MGMSGDFGKLKQWRERMGRMVGVPEKIAIAVAPKVRTLVAAEFASKTDPYGDAWKPIKPATIKRGTESILVRTGRMRDELDVLPFGTRLKVLLGTFYARFHISTGRRTLPKPGQLPEAWSQLIDQEAAKAFKQIAEGGK